MPNRRRSHAGRPERISPVRLLLLVLVVVFAVEAGIMLALSVFEHGGDGLFVALGDSVLLVCALAPALWFLIVRPLRRLVAERGALLTRTMQAQEEERARLARDLHDGLGQAQTALLLGASAVANARTLEEARERAESLRQMAVEALESTRRIARGLAPAVLADLGLEAAVGRMCEDLASASGVSIQRELRVGEPRLPAPVETTAYRVIQEALTNALKHAHARQISVRVERGGTDRLELEVRDDGRGIPDPDAAQAGTGLGLASMRERVVLLGGDFSIASTPTEGTSIRAWLPLHSPNE